MDNIENQDNFKFAGKPWIQQEDQQLIKEYTVDKLNLLDICKIHKRNPNGITSRLKKLNLINMRQNVSGYSEYLESNLYKEIREKKEGKRKNKIDAKDNVSSNTEITELKNEIVSLKKDVKEMLRLIHELYDFESQ